MVDRRVLLPPYLEDAQSWTDLVEAMDSVLGPAIDDPTHWLSKVRDNWIPTTAAEDALAIESAMLANISFETPERDLLIRQANMLGFVFDQPDILSTSDYQRIVRNLALYWYGKGTPKFADFLGFVLDCDLTVLNLWSTQGAEYGTYGPFLPEGDVGIGTPVWEGGTWFPTTHVTVEFDPSKFSDVQVSKLVALFYAIANYNLVIENIILNTTTYVHSVDETELARIVVVYPLTEVEQTIETV
jgi:hypothetical protein